MTLEALATRAMEWAATYAIHSTMLLGFAALATGRLVRRDAWREVLWRGALLGSVATATLATTLPLEPLAGRWSVLGISSPSEAPARGVPPQAARPAMQVSRDDRDAGAARIDAGADAGTARTQDRTVDATGEATTSFAGWLLLGWGTVAALLLALLAAQNVRVVRRLRGREPVDGGRLVAMLAELRRLGGVWSPVRLSTSPAAPTPLVIGASEICLPPRFLDGLGEDEQRAALAHELAHVARRDPWWQLGLAALHALLFFQPLHWLARRRLRDAAENLCDDWAVRQTGSPLALGRCLADIASWVSADPLPHLGSTHAMAEGGSPLLDRVRRIADGTAGAPARRAAPAAATAALLAATLVLAPVVSGGMQVEGFSIGRGNERPASSGQGMVISSTPGPARHEAIAAAVIAAPDEEVQVPADVALLERLAMEDPSPEVRQEAASGLAEFTDPAAVPALLRLARAAADPRVRSEAIQRLDESRSEAVVATLHSMAFEDPVAAVRFEAIDVLAGMSTPTARDALRQIAADHPDDLVRGAALQALPTDE